MGITSSERCTTKPTIQKSLLKPETDPLHDAKTFSVPSERPQHETICRHRRRASRRRPRATRHCARRARAEPVSSRTMYARTSPDSVLPETAPAEKDGRPRRSRRHEAKRKASGRTHCRTLSHHEAQPCRHRARCPPEGREAQPETDSTTRRHDRPAERTSETSRDSQAASDLTELAIPAHSRLPADGDAMCSFPLDIENAVLEKSVSAMKGDCQREARML